MRQNLILFILFFTLSSATYAQDYQTSIGVRGGFASGLSVKHFLNGDAAVEGLLQSRWRGFNITGLYEIHNPISELPGLKWYYGGGAHIGFWNGANVRWEDDERDYTVIGIDGIIGLEYTFSEVPFNISLDWKPAFNFVGYVEAWGDNGALSIRYIID